VPRGVDPETYVLTLIEAAENEHLPSKWDIELRWRNPDTKRGRTQEWQSGEMLEVLNDSASGWGPGFATVVVRVLLRELARIRREPLPRGRKQRKVFLKYSLASRKGWETKWRNGLKLGKKGLAFLAREKQR